MPDALPAQIISAVFKPSKVTDLPASVRPHVGERMTWLWQGPILTGRYEGQWAWLPVEYKGWPGWVPDEDLAGVETIDGYG